MLQRYNLGAIILHWLIAALLAFQLAVGFGLDELGPRGFAVFQLHKSVGIAILLLTVLRIGWRLRAKRPQPVEGGWQGWLAGTVHFGLYVFMLGAPLTGWLLVSTEKVRVPTLLFGAVPWPHIPAPAALNFPAHAAHGLLGLLGIALFALHVAGALRHHWLVKDGLLRRMSPGRTAWPVLLLAALLPVAWALGGLALGSVGKAPPRKPAGPMSQASVAPTPSPPTDTEASSANVAAPTPTAPIRWTIQPGGKLGFSIDNGGARIDGRFATWSGDIVFDPDRPETADIRITVNLASASLTDPTQSKMLAGADFLDVAAHPRAIFTARSARRIAPGHYIAAGTLSLKGHSKAQTLRFTLSGTGAARHVEGSATISRAAFAIGAGEAAATLAPDVTLTFKFDAAGQPAK